MTKFVLGPLIDEIHLELREELIEHEVQITCSGDSGITIHADRTQIGVVIKALTRNAIEAAGPGREINVSVELRPASDELVLAVTDNGPGISEEIRRHLFDPFFSGREAGRGLGFGLSKCWRIVDGHGGRIEVDNRPDGGAVLSVVLPRGIGGNDVSRIDTPHRTREPNVRPLQSSPDWAKTTAR